MRITAAVAVEVGRPLVVDEVELSEDLGSHEVLVRNVATGICHTDVTNRDAPPDSLMGRKPIVLGHEGAGVVERIGSEVTTLAVGDHVVMTYYSDGTCPSCSRGHEAYCGNAFIPNFGGARLDGSHALASLDGTPISGSYHQQSSFATYSIATDRNAIKVQGDLPLETLAPLGCGLLTGAGAVRNRLKPRAGASFAVFGVGALGIAALHMAKKAGCSPIIAVDLHASRLATAQEFGATHVIDASSAADTVAELLTICPVGVDYAYEATGSVAVMEQVITGLATGGSCVLSGVVIDPAVQVKVQAQAFLRGITINGVLLGDGDPVGTIEELIEDIRADRFPIDKIIATYDLHEINDAIRDGERGVTIKPVVRFSAE